MVVPEVLRLSNIELCQLTSAAYHYDACYRYDPGTSVSDDITTEADRVLFLQSIAQSMLTKARIKLNIKRLYAADAVAVKDLLNMAALLYKATCTTANYDEVLCVVCNQECQGQEVVIS